MNKICGMRSYLLMLENEFVTRLDCRLLHNQFTHSPNLNKQTNNIMKNKWEKPLTTN